MEDNTIRCFHCGGKVIWQNDFSFEDYSMDGDGIVHVCTCSDCGAEILYSVPFDEDEEGSPKEESLSEDFKWRLP